MNVALNLLANLGVKRNANPEQASTGTGAPFQPSVVTQQQGLFDAARQKQQQEQQDEEDTGIDPTIGAPMPNQNGSPAPTQKPAQAPAPAPTPDPATQKPTESTTVDQGGSEYIYNGVPVTIENKPEMVALFKEKGLDIDAVNKELFSKDGITADTKAKLDAAFGKMSVDMYLDGWKKTHDAMVSQHKLDEEQQHSKLAAEANEAAGGKWTETLDWATKNLTEAEYNEYAQIINAGGKAMQLAVKELAQRAGLAGTTNSNLSLPSMSPRSLPLKPTSTATVADDYAISAAQYREAITSREYYKNPQEWDKRRNAGMQKGI